MDEQERIEKLERRVETLAIAINAVSHALAVLQSALIGAVDEWGGSDVPEDDADGG